MSKTAAIADLKRSGLTARDFDKLKLKVLSAKANDKLTGNNVPGYLIPYFDIAGKAIPNGWRVRHLEDGFTAFNAKPKKPKRYTGPKGEQPHLYFPQNFGGWKQQAKDVTQPVYITEGEKKAACMCKHGFATMAVPGVWGWRSKDRDIDLLPEFDLIDWGDHDNPRCVIMVFDNDVIIKEQVLHALNALSRKLSKKGAQVFVKHLPPGDLKGADDFIDANGADAFDKLPEELFAESGALCEFQEKVAYIENGNFFSDVQMIDGQATLRTFPDATKLRQAYGNLSYLDTTGDEPKTRYVVDEWLKFPNRRTHTAMTFAPGRLPVIDNKLNTWRAWGVEPKPGTVKPFLDLVNFIFAAEPQVLETFMQWLAYPLQQPGAKMLWGVLIWSLHEGVGKSMIGETMMKIYGAGAERVEKDDITESWTDWVVNKQFILGEEITGDRSLSVADKIKSMVTRPTVRSKVKFQAAFSLPDLANYYLTSNHENSLHLKPADRRWLVVEAAQAMKDDAFYERYAKWRDNNGAAHLFHYLLNEIDCTTFNPNGRAPATASKDEMIQHARPAIDVQIEELLADPDRFLKHNPTSRKRNNAFKRDVYTVKEILTAIGREQELKHLLTPAGYALKRFGCPKRATGKLRLVAVRNRKKWAVADTHEWTENYELDFKPLKSD